MFLFFFQLRPALPLMPRHIKPMRSVLGMCGDIPCCLSQLVCCRGLTHLCSDQLMRSYNATTGLWENTWWESANMISALADFSALDASYGAIYYSTYSTTYNNAPKSQGYPNFLDEYYDDEGWWGLAWLNIYDLTQDSDYLNLAILLFNDMHGGLTTPCGGGIWWDKDKSYIASIANGTSQHLSSIAWHIDTYFTSTIYTAWCWTRQSCAT